MSKPRKRHKRHKRQCIGLFLMICMICMLWLMASALPLPAFSTSTVKPLGTPHLRTDPISLSFQNIPVRTVLQLLADYVGVNLVVGDAVEGSITLKLSQVPWHQALAIILKTQGLAQRLEGSVLMIAPMQVMADQQKADLQAKMDVDNLASLRSELIQIRYAKAEDLAEMLKAKEGSLLSPRGHVSVDNRTNHLWVEDSPSKITEVKRLLQRLDVPVQQVLIEARIVTINKVFEQELGIQWGITRANHLSGTLSGANQVLKSSSPVSVPFQDRLNVNLPTTQYTHGSIGLALARLGKHVLLDLELSAMEAENKGHVIANPKLVTSNQGRARIENGKEVPYQESTSSGATSIAFKKAALSLDVTPQITPDHKIMLTLDIHQDSIANESIAQNNRSNDPTSPSGTSNQVSSVPIISTKQIQTQVLVDHGETIVLGGVYQQTKNKIVQRIPLFGELPVLGRFFKYEDDKQEQEQLLIFITPKILHPSVKKNHPILKKHPPR